MTGKRSDRPDEVLARRIVRHVLGVPVRRFDDGSKDGMPDALIELPAGDAPLEVVSDRDRVLMGKVDALDGMQ